MPISRRSILRFGLGGAALLALGGVGLSLQPTRMRTPRRKLQVLDETTYSILAAIADRISPAGDGFPASTELEVPEKIDALLARSHPAVGAEVKSVLQLIENGAAGLLFDGHPRPFTARTPAEQDATLQAWRSSRLHLRRTAFKAVHGLCTAAYFASPEVYARVGYPGPPDFRGKR